jgi:ABC-2 type transport system permease protein
MSNLFLIVKREYLQRVRTKGFIISTILTPLIFASLLLLPMLFLKFQTGDQKKIAVIDQSGIIYDDLAQALTERVEKGKPKFLLEKVAAGDNVDAVRNDLRDRINKNKLDAYIVIGKDIIHGGEASYYAKNVSNLIEQTLLKTALSNVIIKRRLSLEGLDPARVQELIKRTDLKPIKVTTTGEKEDRGQTYAISFVLVAILYASLIFYGVSIMRSVIEEKSSRIVEVVISSVRSFELMLGKLIGVGAVGLTQIFIWGAFVTLFSLYGVALVASFSPQALAKIDIPLSIMVYFAVYYILGYFLFGSMYAAVGAMVNSEQEAQHAQIPILAFLVIPFVLATFIFANPNSNASTILSLVPFFTPLLMFMRICTVTPPFLQILASIVLLLLTTLGIMWLAAKIYRVGILMYGKRPSLPDLVKWLKYS